MSGKQITELSKSERRRRTFSDTFKKKKVKEIELGRVKVSEISKVYQVSTVSVYRWIDKFGSIKKPEGWAVAQVHF